MTDTDHRASFAEVRSALHRFLELSEALPPPTASARRDAFEHLRRLVGAAPESIERVLAAALPRLEKRLGALSSGTLDQAAVERVLELREELAWYAQIGTTSDARDPLRRIEAEVAWVGRVLERGCGRNDVTLDAARNTLKHVRDELFRQRVQLAVERRATTVAQHFEHMLQIGELLVQCHGNDAGAGGASLSEKRLALRHEITRLMAGGTAIERESAFAGCARQALDHADELLTALDEMPLARGAFTLELIRDDLAFTREQAPAVAQRADTHVWLNKLKTEERWYAREAREKQVEKRMVELFGETAVRLLESTIIAFTFAVLALLAVEALVALAPQWERWFFTIDAIICSVFLAEYLLKTAVAPAHWDYARRHFLLDFLPSIPFGFLTGGLIPADYAQAGRALRLLRLPMLARYARVLRPVVRLLRVAGFFLRGMDRLVRSQARLLNVNIIFLEDDEPHAEHLVETELDRLRRRLKSWLSEALPTLAPDARRAILEAELATISLAIDRQHASAPATRAGGRQGLAREIHFVRLAELLHIAQARDVEALLDRNEAERLGRLLAFLDRPILRWTPIFGRAARGCGRITDAYERIAHAARSLGTRLQKLVERGRTWGDLYGVVTAPQMLDRFGTAIAKATQRPALRLLLFGFGFLLAQLIAQASGSSGLLKVARTLNGLLGTPILIFGMSCLMLLLIAKWMQQISGEATDTFRRVSEAQYASLVKELKLARQALDLATLDQRVLAFESRLAPLTPAERVAAIRQELDRHGPHSAAYQAHDLERVMLLYRDYLDGGVLHRGAVKMSEQLLGNLAIQNIYHERLRISKREKKLLRKLDLQADTFFSFGPNAWFQFITASVAEQVAKLVLDYNRNCIPLDQMPLLAAEEREPHERWLAQGSTIGTRDTRRATARLSALASDSSTLTSTHFHSLHFLTADAARDASIAAVFGGAVRDRLQRDRRALIRHIFGRYPFERIPRHNRTLNLYDLYWDQLGGGRLVLLPIKAAWWWVKVIAFALHQLLRTARQLLVPKIESEQVLRARGDLRVAYRKIFRMQRPLFLECAWLRARFDPEYLGCRLPRQGEPAAELASAFADLTEVAAPTAVIDRFTAMRNQVQASLDRLAEFLAHDVAAQAWGADEIRSVCIAHTINYHDVATMLELERDVRSACHDAEQQHGRALPRAAPAPQPLSGEKPTLIDLHRVLNELGIMRTRAIDKWFQRNVRGLKQLVAIASRCGGARAARSKAVAIFTHVAARHRVWLEQLLTLRTLQTLCVLEVAHTCDTVRTLGAYESKASATES